MRKFLIFRVMICLLTFIGGSCSAKDNKPCSEVFATDTPPDRPIENTNSNLLSFEGIFYKKINENDVEVTPLPKKKKYAGNIIIPEYISVGGHDPFLGDITNDIKESQPRAYKVVAIGDRAFKDCEDLIKVEMPSELQYIGREAFAGCINLLEVKMPNIIGKIEDKAFEGSQFRTLVITGSVDEIGDRVFYGVNAGYIKLDQCELTALDKETFANSTIKRIYLPQGLKVVPENSFKGCRNLMYVQFNNSLEDIRANAFSGCRQLKALSLPSSLAKIGKDAFSGVQIKSIAFEKSAAPDFKLAEICTGDMPSLIAYPAEGEEAYHSWCPQMYAGKCLLSIKDFRCMWLYPGVITTQGKEEVWHAFQFGISGYDSDNLKLLISKGEDIAIIYPMIYGASYDDVLFDEDNTSKELVGGRLSDSPLGICFSNERYVTIHNITGNYRIERIQTDAYIRLLKSTNPQATEP